MKISSNKKPNKSVSFVKVVDTIDSCLNEEHLRNSRKFIDIYFQMYKPEDNKFEVEYYARLTSLLTSILIDKYDELGIEFTI